MKRDPALIPIVTAWLEGKQIEYLPPRGGWISLSNPGFNKRPELYRIAPSATYRPYTPQELFDNVLGKKLIEDETNIARLFTTIIRVHIGACGVSYDSSYYWTPKGLLEKFTHIDGSPCGVKE